MSSRINLIKKNGLFGKKLTKFLDFHKSEDKLSNYVFPLTLSQSFSPG